MAYCDKCGAYIPDGQAKCLACGYDPTEQARAESKKAAAAQYWREEQAEARRREERVRAEEERRREEEARADEERRRRIENDRRWAEKEYARRRAERVQNMGSVWENTGYSRPSAENKPLGILSYFSFLFVLPYIFAPNDKFCRFHANQGLALFVFCAIADALSATPFGWIMQIMRVYMMVKGIVSAAKGRCEPLPFIGKYVNK